MDTDKSMGILFGLALAAFACGCLTYPEEPRAQLEPGWKQSEMLVMSFNLKGERGTESLNGLVEAVDAVKPRYVALQDLTKAQAEELAKRLGMRADWSGSGADWEGPSGVAVLSRGERVMNVSSLKTKLGPSWSAANPRKVVPRAAVSVQFAEHNIATALIDDSTGLAEALRVAREVPRMRPPVIAFGVGTRWTDKQGLAHYAKSFRTCSPADANSDSMISTPWNFSSQFGLDWNRKVQVKGFGGREAVLVNIKY